MNWSADQDSKHVEREPMGVPQPAPAAQSFTDSSHTTLRWTEESFWAICGGGHEFSFSRSERVPAPMKTDEEGSLDLA